jgi:hypothetical protein
MVKRLLLLTLFSLHSTSYCTFEKMVNALKPFKQELTYVGSGLAASGAGLVIGGYLWGSSNSKAALEKKKFDIEHANQQRAEQARLEKVRLEEKEKKDKEEALKAAILRKKQAATFATSMAKEYCDEIELLNAEKLNEHNHDRFSRIIVGKHNQKPFNNYYQILDENIRKLAQLEDTLDKQQFEYMESQLKAIRNSYNFLFSKHQHEEAMAAQKEKNAADIKRIEIEHAQLQNQKLQNEQDALIETKKALRSFSEHNRALNKTLQEVHASNQQIASTVNTYKNDVNSNIRAHEANHQRMALQLQSRETMLDRKFEAQAVEVTKMNTQLAEVLVPLKQLAKIAEDANKAAAQVAQAQSRPVTGHPAPVTSTSSTTTSSVPTTAEQAPPPSFVGDSIAFNSIPAIPVPTQPHGIQPIPVPTTR